MSASFRTCSAKARASWRSGAMRPDGTFRASEVLAKHDENYMPKDVADALKKSGHWNPSAGPPPPAATWNTMQTGKRRKMQAGG